MDDGFRHPEKISWQTFIRSPLSFISLVKKKHASTASLNRLIDHVADTVDPSIKSVGGYRRRLSPRIIQCQAHCRKIVEQIPGPIYLDDPNYSSVPLIKAAFPGNVKIAPILREAEESLNYQGEKETTRVALLTMTHEERDFFGSSREGRMLVADARLTSVTFSDHRIVGLATTLEESRHRLEKVIFEVIIEAASHELAGHKADYGELTAQKEKLKAMLRLFGEQTGRTRGAAGEGAREKANKVKTLLAETENSLYEEKANVEMPEDRLDFLADYLSQPEKVMDIELISLRLDWRNVLTQNPEESADFMQFAQCTIHNTVKRDAVLISYSVENISSS